MIVFGPGGTSATFISETTPRTVTGSTGTTAQIDAAYAAWLLLHPEPPIVLPVTIIQLPTSNPGITGALHLVGNTLFVSAGPTGTAVQIGSTGPTGGAAVL